MGKFLGVSLNSSLDFFVFLFLRFIFCYFPLLESVYIGEGAEKLIAHGLGEC